MKGLSKEHINCTFGESLFSLCEKYKILPCQMTMSIRILEKGKILFQLCRNGIAEIEIPLLDILTPKMIGLRFSPQIIENLFKTVHKAFMMQTGCENPVRISLVFYQSKKANCPCIGVKQDEKTLKVMKLSNIIEAIELESEQLN
jgi:hypothetical protein